MSDHGTIWVRENANTVTLFAMTAVDHEFVVYFERTVKPTSIAFPIDFGPTKLVPLDQWNAMVAEAVPLTKEVLDDLRCAGNKPVH